VSDIVDKETGEVTEQARAFAVEKRINLLQGSELTTLLR